MVRIISHHHGGKGGTAVWENESPFYLYVQDPQTARLVFTLFDEDIIGGGHSIGSAHGKLIDLLPKILVTIKDTNTNNIDMLKSNIISILTAVWEVTRCH